MWTATRVLRRMQEIGIPESECRKSHRVAVVFSPEHGIIVVGTNRPPEGFLCAESDHCRLNCSSVAVHAEQQAILKAAYRLRETSDWELLHIKFVDGAPVTSGEPSCVQCSKLILECGWFRQVWLYQEDEEEGGEIMTGYSPEEFHALSLASQGLPIRSLT